ncbi:MAM and LDL-receptor class A domain-containing protein 1-like [Pecten maximus]|uniref:MAM and LDL-receptor class A domain-containing protein 1-like n=1 Tax=Pecten maximus TaxID=6579 RepID=UPI001459109F|nr:MAM and LDL-receptor class A domain-containing protein 1-like [Pecten maximus]
METQIQTTDSSLNESKLRLEKERDLGTREIARLQSALSLTSKSLATCNTSLVAIQTHGTSTSSGADTHLIYCGFEDSSLCGFTQESSSESWKRGSGRVSTTTGPLSDHTYGSVTGHYMYLDPAHVASYSSTKHVVRMTSPLLSPSTGYCLRFWYNMYGTDIETLNVYAKIFGGSGLGNPVYTHTGQVDRNWHMAEVSLDSEYTVHSFNFMFEATTHAHKSSHYTSGHSSTTTSGANGNIAIDDVYIYNTSCRHNDMSSCPAGAHIYQSNTSSNACYMIHVVPATWYNAAKACKEEAGNAHLVSINSAEEQTYLLGIINADQGLKAIGQNGFYTSGNDERIEGTFEWTDHGSHLPVTYTDWHQGQPNNVGGDQDCLLMQYADSNYEWGDVGCNEKHPFICEINQ